jgi:hypothetical protein
VQLTWLNTILIQHLLNIVLMFFIFHFFLSCLRLSTPWTRCIYLTEKNWDPKLNYNLISDYLFKDAADKCGDGDEDVDGVSSIKRRRWNSVWIGLMVCVRRNFLLPRYLRGYHVWSYLRPHVSRPCRPRDSST